MRLAQQLYEGIDIKGNGTVGLITYLRTDSTRISDEADAGSKKLYRRSSTEKNMWQKAARREEETKKIQDAHEAIRPTDISQNSGT